MRKGGRFASGLDFNAVDALVGLGGEHGELLDCDDLVERNIEVLRAAARFARQLPAAVFDVPIPGMENVHRGMQLPDGTPIVRADGTPYIPHRTSLGLVVHLVGHAVKLKVLLDDPATDAAARLELWGPFGEPDEDVGIEALAAELEGVAEELRRRRPCWTTAALAHEIQTWTGPQSLHWLVQFNTYSIVQHTRQMMALLRAEGIEPDGRIGEAEFRGLGVPVGVWE